MLGQWWLKEVTPREAVGQTSNCTAIRWLSTLDCHVGCPVFRSSSQQLTFAHSRSSLSNLCLKHIPFGRKPSLETETVFRISGIPEHTYVTRTGLTEKIERCLKSRDGIPVFLGYSKSGKTVFRKKSLDTSGFRPVVFRCNNQMSVDDLYNQIATELELGQLKSTSKSRGSQSGVDVSAKLGGGLFGGIGLKRNENSSRSNQEMSEFDRAKIDVNFLCNRITATNVLVILEDYHLANKEFNSVLSEDLKHFLDEEVLFLLIGIPSSPDRSLRFNPDLSGRVVRANFDYLTTEEIRQLIKTGTELLGVRFLEEVVDEIVECSMKNAYLVQFICRQILLNNHVNKTVEEEITIRDKSEVHKACTVIAESLNSDYISLYDIVHAGARRQKAEKVYNQYAEILHAIKTFNIEKLERGIEHKQIAELAWGNSKPLRLNGSYVMAPTKTRNPSVARCDPKSGMQ